VKGIDNPMRLMVFIYLLTLCSITSVIAQESNILSIDMLRHAYYRGEFIPITITFRNSSASVLNKVVLSAGLFGIDPITCTIGPIQQGESITRLMRVPTALAKTGNYRLNVSANYSGGKAAATETVYIGTKPNPDAILVWNWGGNGDEWDLKHGFNTLCGTTWAQKECADKDFLKRMDDAIVRNAYTTFHPCGGLTEGEGLSRLDLSDIKDPDSHYTRLSEYYREHNYTMPNPFYPEIAGRQNERNKKIMEFMKDFPQIKFAFFNSELCDMMDINLNKGGLELMQSTLGFTDENTGPPNYVAPNVIADDDKGYLLHKYIAKQGKGWNLTNERAAEMVHRYRKDIWTITDPYRDAALLDMFPGIDVVGTWTYTNPDPKLMLYVETMRAVCKPTGQIPLNVVTMLNDPGMLAPTKKWMSMGPGRLKVTTWINLSRAPKIIGYYPPFKNNSFYPDPDCFENPYSTALALKELSEKVFKPYGPMITNLEVSPRKIAVLCSDAARLYGKSPALGGWSPNMQIYHFYTVLAMAHLQADVVFDETIERFGLSDYDVLVLPKCDVLPQSVYKNILDFQKRGGIIIADQYLGPEIPGVIKFDFDFTYRIKVSANAIANNKAYTEWNDLMDRENAKYQDVTGVTALDDQKIMESYAARLKKGLKDIVEPDIECSEPTALLSVLEKDGAKYLFVINDKRTYDERLGKYKSVLEKIEPQTVTVSLKNWEDKGLSVYDLLERKALKVQQKSGIYQFKLSLTELGGKLIALYPKSIDKLSIEFPSKVRQGSVYPLLVHFKDADMLNMPGLQPVKLTVTDPKGTRNSMSDYYCAKKGLLSLDLVAARNDAPGEWKINVEDLTSGLKIEKRFTMLKK